MIWLRCLSIAATPKTTITFSNPESCYFVIIYIFVRFFAARTRNGPYAIEAKTKEKHWPKTKLKSQMLASLLFYFYFCLIFFALIVSKKMTNSVFANKAPRTECLRFQNGWTFFLLLSCIWIGYAVKHKWKRRQSRLNRNLSSLWLTLLLSAPAAAYTDLLETLKRNVVDGWSRCMSVCCFRAACVCAYWQFT